MGDPSVQRFKRVISVALTHLEARRQEINDLNVFPVADGDTGDNMALTMRHVLDELERLEQEVDEPPSRPEIVRAVARAALMGARGNSGVILSQIVRGAAGELATPPGRLIDPELVESALMDARDAAYAAIREPAEGTMLTVISEMATAVAERRAQFTRHKLGPESTHEEQNALLAEMLAAALFAGEEAVRRSPEQLDVLAAAGVVDAGALGLVVIVRGMVAGLAGEEVQLPEISHFAPARGMDVHHADDSRFRYCTNFIVTGEGLDGQARIGALEALGDSVLVVGDEATLKVHVHTDDVDAATALFEGLGSVERLDVADMREQIAEREARLAQAVCTLVAVAGGDGIQDMFRALGAVVVDGGPTLNPPTKDLLAAIERAPGFEVLLMPNSANVVLAAEEAAKHASKPTTVLAVTSQQAGLVLAAEFDQAVAAEDNAERLRASLAGLRVGGVAAAAKDDAEGRFVRGDAVGFEGDEVIVWGGAGSALRTVVERLASDAELVTVIAGAQAPIGLDELPIVLGDGTELELRSGGQPHWHWLVCAE